MPSLRQRISGYFNRSKTPVSQPVGAPAVVSTGGYLQTFETSPDLIGSRKWKTYREAIANVAIIATAIRLRLDLMAKPTWTCEPQDGIDTPEAWEYAERAEKLFRRMETPLPQAVQRSGLFVDYGFGIQTWHLRRNEEGWLEMADLRPIACHTVERWDLDPYGRVRGVEQRDPETQECIWIPRERMLYLADDVLNDSPEGLGLLRQVVEAARRLGRLEQLEIVGYDTDLSGVPKLRAPVSELNAAVNDQTDTEAAARRTAVITPLTEFAQKHNRGAKTALLLDSATYPNADGSPSTVYKQDAELFQNGANNLGSIDTAIMRHIKLIALVYGVEGLLIGMESTGAYALAKDKTTKLHLVIDALLNTIKSAYQRDLLDRVWTLNGWPEEMKPQLKVEPVNRADVVQVMAVLEGLARAGIMMRPDDPAIDAARMAVELPPQPPPDPVVEGLLSQLTRPDAEGSAAGELDANPEPFEPTAPAASMELEPAKDAQDVAARVTAATALIRAGFEPEASLVAAVGLDHITHSGMQPITVKPAAQVDAEAEAAAARVEG